MRARLASTNSRSPTSSVSRAGIGAGQFGAQLGDFLIQFLKHRFGVGPVEADPGGAGGQLGGTGQGGQGGRHPGQRAGLGAGGALGGFLRLPGRGLGRGVARGGVAEHVRMAADHLVGDGARHIGEGEVAGFLGHAGVIDHLEQQVAQLVRQGGEVAPGDGVGDLVGLLDRVGRDRVEVLLLVPRAAGRPGRAARP